MSDDDVISISSDSSRRSTQFFSVSDILNDSEKQKVPLVSEVGSDIDYSVFLNISDTNVKHMSAICSPSKERAAHTLSNSDDSDTEKSSNDVEGLGNLWAKYGVREGLKSMLPESKVSNQGENNTFDNNEIAILVKDNKKPTKLTKEQKLEEKIRKQNEKEKIRAEKLASKKLQDQMKPGNCMKYVSVVLDSTIVTCQFGGSLIAAIQNSESKYQIKTQSVPYTVIWTRELPEGGTKEESDVVVVWEWQLVIPALKNHTLCSQIEDIQKLFPGKSMTLVIYGLNGYFSYLKSRRRNDTADSSKAQKRKMTGEDYPYVTRKDIEEELIELQVMVNCKHRLIESQEDLGQLFIQITKAIAETPFKLDKQKRELEDLEWFAVGDSRDCVTVDKAGNGLLRLWQQQLCQFNLAGHDVAQAIVAVYPSPLSIVKAYQKCSSQKEAEELLKDIPVRRCQGPLSSNRRIGPELSKKIYMFFSLSTGDTPLSQ